MNTRPLLVTAFTALLPLALVRCSGSTSPRGTSPVDAAPGDATTDAPVVDDASAPDAPAPGVDAAADAGPTDDAAPDDAAPDGADADLDATAPCSLRLSGTTGAVLDPTFGQPEITSVLSPGFYNVVYGAVGRTGDVFVALQDEGSSPLLIHVTAAGKLDTSFGSGGAITLPWRALYGVYVDDAGDAIVSGSPSPGGYSSAWPMLVAGFHPDGTLFLSVDIPTTLDFATIGPVVPGAGGFLTDTPNGLAIITTGGQITYADAGARSGGACQLVRANAWAYLGCDSSLTRYALDGTLDPTFPAQGYAWSHNLTTGGGTLEIPASDSTLYLVPYDLNEVIHLLDDSSLDTSFGTVVPTSLPQAAWQRCDGNLLLAEPVYDTAGPSTVLQLETVAPAAVPVADASTRLSAAGSIPLNPIPDAGVGENPILYPLAIGADGAITVFEEYLNRGWVYRVLPSQ